MIDLNSMIYMGLTDLLESLSVTNKRQVTDLINFYVYISLFSPPIGPFFPADPYPLPGYPPFQVWDSSAN